MPEETSLNNETTISEAKDEAESEKATLTQPYKTFETEDDYKKVLKSERSKGKNDILSQMGVSSVDEFINLKNTYNSTITDLENKNKDIEKLKDENIVLKLGIPEDNREDFLTIAKSKVDNEHSLESNLKDLMSKYGLNSKIINPSFKMGTEKTNEGKPKEYPDSLSNRYPWLKNN